MRRPGLREAAGVGAGGLLSPESDLIGSAESIGTVEGSTMRAVLVRRVPASRGLRTCAHMKVNRRDLGGLVAFPGHG